MNDESLRLATPQDLYEIEQLVTASYAKYLPHMDRAPAPLERDYAAAIENREIWVVGDPIQGLISLITKPEAVLLIENIAVHPSNQGSGRGRELMDFAEVVATDRGLNRLALYTNEAMTENLSLYEHFGFSVVDRRTEDGYRRVYMEKILSGSC